MTRFGRTRVLTIALAAGVAVAFADSSIVVLALPDLYGEFDTTLVGVSWVITSYNLVVAVAALCLVPFARRLRPRPTGIVGIGALRRRLRGLRRSLEPRRPHRLPLPAGARRRAAAGRVAARPRRVRRDARSGEPPCGRRRDDRRRCRAGARRRADAALRLARDLRRPGAAGARRDRRDGGRTRSQPPAGAPRDGGPSSRARGRHRAGARLRRARGGAFPLRAAGDHRLVAGPGGGRARRQRPACGRARRPPARDGGSTAVRPRSVARRCWRAASSRSRCCRAYRTSSLRSRLPSAARASGSPSPLSPPSRSTRRDGPRAAA